MTQTIRSRDGLIAEFPDNLLRLISPEDSRDLIVSAFGFIGPIDPTPQDDVDNDAGNGFFDAGSWWLNDSAKTIWRCFDGSHNAADWRQIYPAGVPQDNLNFAVVNYLTDTSTPLSGLYPMTGGTPAANALVLVSDVAHPSPNQGLWRAQAGAWVRPSMYFSGKTYEFSPLVALQYAPYGLLTSIEGFYWAGNIGAPIEPITVDTTVTTWRRMTFGTLGITTDGTVLVAGGNSLIQELAGNPEYPLSLPTPTPLSTILLPDIGAPPAPPSGTDLEIYNVGGTFYQIDSAAVATPIIGGGGSITYQKVTIDYTSFVGAPGLSATIDVFSFAAKQVLPYAVFHAIQNHNWTTNVGTSINNIVVGWRNGFGGSFSTNGIINATSGMSGFAAGNLIYSGTGTLNTFADKTMGWILTCTINLGSGGFTNLTGGNVDLYIPITTLS